MELENILFFVQAAQLQQEKEGGIKLVETDGVSSCMYDMYTHVDQMVVINTPEDFTAGKIIFLIIGINQLMIVGFTMMLKATKFILLENLISRFTKTIHIFRI